MVKDYKAFKELVNAAIEQVNDQNGVKVLAKRWRKESPFQKRRYKPEYVYPECWVYRADGGRGAVLVGDDVPPTARELADRIEDYLF